MIITLYIAAFTAILIGIAGVLNLFTRLSEMSAAERTRTANLVDVSRYEPMQRLLSSRDLDLVAGDRGLSSTLRKQRTKVFRSYLRCLTKDFGALLGGVRQIMVDSSVDRPELANLVVRTKWNFLLSLCRIEASLFLYERGLAAPDVSGLMAQVKALGQIQLVPDFSPMAA